MEPTESAPGLTAAPGHRRLAGESLGARPVERPGAQPRATGQYSTPDARHSVPLTSDPTAGLPGGESDAI